VRFRASRPEVREDDAVIVASLTRYPVKSLRGQPVDAVDVTERGVAGDRTWFVRTEDGFMGSGKATRRFRAVDGLLELAATLGRAGGGAGVPRVRFPDGAEHAVGTPEADAALAAHTGRAVTFVPEAEVMTFDEGPVHLLTTAALRRLADEVGEDVDPARFRANVLVDTPAAAGTPEDDWRTVRLGDEVVLRVEGAMPRCVMVTMASGPLAEDRRVLKAVHAANGGDLGIWASVVRPGRVAVGDAVVVLD